MGLLAKIKSLFGNKYDKLTREQINDAMIALQQQEEKVEDSVQRTATEIDELMAKGKAERDQQMRLFIAKKITMLRERRKQAIEQATFLMYNLRLMEKLKDALEQKEFFRVNSSVPLNALLGDQRGLARFLNDALGTRVAAEQVMTAADETFTEVASAYERNEAIYGVSQNDDQLLAMFEDADALAGDATSGHDAAEADGDTVAREENTDGTV